MRQSSLPSIEEVDAKCAQCADREALERVQTYCTFIGYPYSGHSLIGSLLDAHPNMVVAHELNALRYIRAGFNQQQLFYLILENSRTFTAEGRIWNDYHYAVPNQWHGRYRDLRVIGDKKGGGSSRELQSNPELLDRLAAAIPLRRKFIHIIRNPFDNISTINKRMLPDLPAAVALYFRLTYAVVAVTDRLQKDDVFELKHEEFLSRPKELLNHLCRFLGEEASPDYLDDCASIVREAPNKSRTTVAWTAELKEYVQHAISHFPFLAGYSFES